MLRQDTRAREGGFSVIIVLILLIMLVGVALIVLSTSRGDVFGATNERESAIALYAAEAGIAHGKAYMASIPYDQARKYSALIGVTLPKQTFEFVIPNTTPEVRVSASYTVKFSNNYDMAADGGGDADGKVIIHSEGEGPNGALAIVETTSGPRETMRSGVGYCAQANPPPSCRGQ